MRPGLPPGYSISQYTKRIFQLNHATTCCDNQDQDRYSHKRASANKWRNSHLSPAEKMLPLRRKHYALHALVCRHTLNERFFRCGNRQHRVLLSIYPSPARRGVRGQLHPLQVRSSCACSQLIFARLYLDTHLTKCTSLHSPVPHALHQLLDT